MRLEKLFKGKESKGVEEAEDIDELRGKAQSLLKELNAVHALLSRLGDSVEILPPPGKSGYLFKWQDRSIGWGGTKWALRYVTLNRGRISYFLSHLENSPRYLLSLRGCAVRDEGWKKNRRHFSKTTPRGKDPPIEEVGAYFFVFSIYHYDGSNPEQDSADIVPLLRFSTPSLGEKTQWIQLLSEACAYCETDSFLKEEAARNAEEEFRRQHQIIMAQAMPQAERGTLPPLYFGKAEKRSGMVRRPSLSKLPEANLFRSKSKSSDADKSEEKGYPPSRPMHRTAAPSFLSTEAQAQNYRGFLNLGMLILIVSNFRLFLNSAQTYGFVLSALPDLSTFSIGTWEQFPFVTGILLLQVSLILAFAIEWLLAHKKVYEPVGMILHHLNAHSSFAFSVIIVWNFIGVPAIGACLMLNSAIVWLKLLSYAHANQDYRLSSRKKDYEVQHQNTLALIESLDQEDMGIEYPQNITIGNIYYFWIAPTLTYQIAFPKTPRVRKTKVLGILLRMVIVFSLFTFLIAQTVAPNLENLLEDLEKTGGKITVAIMAEYWLKLSIPNTYLWLMTFYFYFHLYLNLCAELLRFGDRVFYRDWWNSCELGSYWRLWNLPVHYWLVRHLYFPCVRIGIPKGVATFVVFFFSAVMHEVLISLPFHMLRPWSFLGMMGQVPLVVMTKYLYRKNPGSSVGNLIFWTSFCLVGQPSKYVQLMMVGMSIV